MFLCLLGNVCRGGFDILAVCVQLLGCNAATNHQKYMVCVLFDFKALLSVGRTKALLNDAKADFVDSFTLVGDIGNYASGLGQGGMFAVELTTISGLFGRHGGTS